MTLNLIATCTAGLEVVVKRELTKLGYQPIKVELGRISFVGEKKAIPICNLWLRSADRVLLEMGRLFTPSFDHLYEGIKKIPWGEILPRNASFPITVKTTRSRLKSSSACQSVAKKAVVDSLSKVYKQTSFGEDGPSFPIIISLEKDEAMIAIDTTGEGLHKRGYRKKAITAPLQETLGAGMIYLSYWQGNRHLYDPFCGSGTIPIEAALIYHNMAPGLKRTFISQDWPLIAKSLWREAKEEAEDLVIKDSLPLITGSDISWNSIQKASFHAKEAGVHHSILFKVQPFSELLLKEEYGALISNPPYGEREKDKKEVEDLYRLMGQTLGPLKTWSYYILTSHHRFEDLFSRKATKRRKLYNGGLKCQFYQYHGPRREAHV